jgi:hypothetical protein
MSRELRTRARARIQPDTDDESDESAADDDVPAQIPSTSIQDLINPADAQQFDQTFSDADANLNIEGAFDPVAGPKQVIPRVAYVLNFNLLYNEQQGRWEPQRSSDTGNSGAGALSGVSRITQTSSQSVPNGTPTTLQFDTAESSSIGTVDLSSNSITITESGAYVITAGCGYSELPTDSIANTAIHVNGTRTVIGSSSASRQANNALCTVAITAELDAGDTVTAQTTHLGNSTEQTESLDEVCYLAIGG